MTPAEQTAFVEAYGSNVASLPADIVADFVARYESGEDIDYCGDHTFIMDALGIWHSAIEWKLEQEKSNA